MSILYKHLIRPFEVKGSLTRYGKKSDGGYIVNEEYLKNINRLYSYGLADDISFENEILTNKNIIGHLYDHTIQKPTDLTSNGLFHKEGLSLFKNESCDNFLNHVKQNNDIDNKILLKIDVEGAEIDYFEAINLDSFSNVIQMIVEFHSNINHLKYIKSLIKINEYFYCCHIHGNNGGGILIKNQDETYSDITEFTFINKKYVNYNPIYYKNKYPINGLDYPNLPNQQDFFFDFTQI